MKHVDEYISIKVIKKKNKVKKKIRSQISVINSKIKNITIRNNPIKIN
jgi:hypothetical protein